MSEFRNRGLEVVVDTTKEAEWQFASKQIPETTQDEIARKLKQTPFRSDDVCIGSLVIRCVANWDIGYTVSPDEGKWVITIWMVELPGELENNIELLMRAGKEQLPPGVKALLEGGRRK